MPIAALRWGRNVLAGAICLAAAWSGSLADPARPPASEQERKPATRLGIKGTAFTLNGEPTFLLGVSYYGALGAPEATITRDLADSRKHGFNWVRVWATWAAFGIDVSAVDADGAPREEYLKKLRKLVAECDRRGVVVDVTLSRGNGVTGPPRLQSLRAHRRAVETLVGALNGYRNWYLDLGNERSVRDRRFVSIDELGELRALALKLDPGLLVTASHHGVDLTRDDVRQYVRTARLDFLSPHRPRAADSLARTEAKTREYLAWMKELGRDVPVHYQEPFRRGYGRWQPKAEDFADDLKGARAGGAAGWCFHNGDQRAAEGGKPRRCFDLREKPLFDQLDGEENRALRLLTGALRR
jgi:hypothetical protein